ncbi:MAG: hypothetical protein VCD00_03190 [Candidatus Hydrogenedentota bacterium]
MLFEINEKNGLEPVTETWSVQELQLEEYVLGSQEDGVLSLNYSVFNEELLFIDNQTKTKKNKRADILAIDKQGNAVIIELKKDRGALGVETQALQYLADFSRYKGESFLKKFANRRVSTDDILGFLGGDVRTEDINRNSRIILVANRFDGTLFSMGEWLSSKGVGFRCISFHPIQAGKSKYISFSMTFDKSPEFIYPLEFSSATRSPKIFWHNIGEPQKQWWSYLKEHGELSASFQNQEGDQGEAILKNYMVGDRVIAFARGVGAIGWGVISREPNSSYKLYIPGQEQDVLRGRHLHRIKISWKDVAPTLSDGMSVKFVRDEMGVHHPRSTSVGIENAKGEVLISKLKEQFGTR